MTLPRSAVVIDGTPLDTDHRVRGIGRYVRGLLQGFRELPSQDGSDELDLRVLRLRGDRDGTDLPTVKTTRWTTRSALSMHLENRVRMDGFLPPGTALYHATGMEGACRRTPWVATCHDLVPLLLPEDYLPLSRPHLRLFWQEYVRLLRRRSVRVIAISEHVRSILIERFDVAPDKVDVVYHGLDPFWSEDPEEPAPRLAGVSAAPFVLFVGGFDPRKNLSGLVEAFALLPESIRPRLVVAGRRPAAVRADHAALLAASPGVDVQFLGYVSDHDLRWLYSKATLLAFPSKEEGWGLPIVEAMAAGTPVVCGDRGSMREAAGEAAVTTDVEDPFALACAIETVLSNDGLRRRTASRGRERVSSLSWAATARATAAVYRQAIDG